jgi:hypothetical protein
MNHCRLHDHYKLLMEANEAWIDLERARVELEQGCTASARSFYSWRLLNGGNFRINLSDYLTLR